MAKKAKKAPKAEPKPDGRPPWEPTAEQRGKVAAWSEAGYTQDDIAERLEVAPKTLRAHCPQELKYGKMDLITSAVRQLGRMACGAPAQFDESGNQVRAEVPPNLGAICFLLKTQGKKLGWSERLELTGKNGDPLIPDLSGLSDAELATIAEAKRIFAALTAQPAGGTGNPQTTH